MVPIDIDTAERLDAMMENDDDGRMEERQVQSDGNSSHGMDQVIFKSINLET